ncbi:hypothetical protein CR513_41792, partial [Mucuna pruriens]
MKVKSDSVKEIKTESNLSIQSRAESNSNSEGRKQVEAKSISNNRVQNLVPSEFNSNGKMKVEANFSNQIGVEFNLDNLRKQQQKAKINSVHSMLSPTQVGQSDPKPTDDISPSLPPTQSPSGAGGEIVAGPEVTQEGKRV